MDVIGRSPPGQSRAAERTTAPIQGTGETSTHGQKHQTRRRMGLRDRRKKKVAENAASLVEEGESVELVAIVNQKANLKGSATTRVVATGEAVYVIRFTTFGISKLDGVESRHPIGEVALERKDHALGVDGAAYFPLLRGPTTMVDDLVESPPRAPEPAQPTPKPSVCVVGDHKIRPPTIRTQWYQ